MSFQKTIKYFFIKLKITLFANNKHINKGIPVQIESEKVVHVINDTEYPKQELMEFVTEIHKIRPEDKFFIISNEFEMDHDFVNLISINDITIFGSVKRELRQLLSGNNVNIALSYIRKCNEFDEMIVSRLDASFKGGIFNSDHLELFDLTINYSTKKLFAIFENFELYIKKLNINR